MISELQTPNGERSRFPSLTSVKAFNKELLKRRRSSETDLEFIEEVKTFVKKSQATGAILNVDSDRWTCQSVVDYWANFLDRNGTLSGSEILLDPFDPALATEIPEERRPYVGLQAFRESKHSLFFGRQRVVDELLKKLADHRFLAVAGPSGSGKSSLVLAGLTPALKQGKVAGSDKWQYLTAIAPGFDPLASLATIIRPNEPRTAESLRGEIDLLKRNPRRLLELINENGSEPALVIVDQFEEIFTLTSDETVRKAFSSNLISLIEHPDLRHTVIITVRSDFEPYFSQLPELLTQFQNSNYRLTPLSDNEFREAIQAPAELAGLKFEAGIVDELVAEAANNAAGLALLQFTLLKLWDARTNNLVTWESFHKMGGCREALTRSADAFYASLSPIDQTRVKSLLLRLVRPGKGAVEVFSNRVPRASLYPGPIEREATDRVLDGLIKTGLVRETEGTVAGEVKVEIAHETLVRQWQRLVGWLDEERVSMGKRLQLTEAANQWEASGRDPSFLLRGSQLEQAQRYEDLNQQERSFVKASVGRKNLTRRLAVGALAVAFLVLVVVALVLYRSRSEALTARSEALSRQLAAEAQRTMNDQPDLALLLSLEAYRVVPTAAARNSLFAVLNDIPHLTTYLPGATGAIATMAYDSGGTVLTAVQEDGSVLTWDANSHQLLKSTKPKIASAETEQGAPRVHRLLSHDQKIVAVQKTDSIVLLDTTSAKQIRELKTRDLTGIYSLSFSPDDKFLAATYDFDSAGIQVWNVADGSERDYQISGGSSESLYDVEFSSNSKTLAVIADHTNEKDEEHYRVVIIDLKQGSRRNLEVKDGEPVCLEFSADGNLLAAGQSDGSVRLWKVAGGKELVKITYYGSGRGRGHSAAVSTLALSNDTNTLASAHADGSIAIWNLKKSMSFGFGLRKTTFDAHSNSITSLAFSPDGKSLASADKSKNIILWSVESSGSLQTELNDCDLLSVFSVAYSPNGRLIAEAGEKKVVFFDAATGGCTDKALSIPHDQNVIRPEGQLRQRDYVDRVTFTSDGKLLAHYFERGAGKAVLWDLDSGQVVRALKPEQSNESITDVTVSPNGKILLWKTGVTTSGGPKNARLTVWRYESEQPRVLIPADEESFVTAFSGNSELFAVGSKQSGVTVWNTSSFAQIAELPQPQQDQATNNAAITSLAFTNDSHTLAAGRADSTIVLWDVVKHQLLDDPLVAHKTAITDVGFNQNGNILISSSRDGVIVLWEVSTRQLFAQIPSQRRGFFTPPVLSNDGKYLIFCDGYGRASILTVSMESWQQKACSIANRKLSPNEWRQFFGKEPYHTTCSN